MPQNVFSVGGSRHIGYYAALRHLDAGSTVTFLLRHPENFDNDEAIQGHVKAGRAVLVKGDALVKEDVHKAWAEANQRAPVDVVLFTLGYSGQPKFHLREGFKISPDNLVTQSLFNTLSALTTNPTDPSTPAPAFPKLVFLSTIGVTRYSRKSLPLIAFPLKLLYGYLIAHPLRDKRACERILSHMAEWEWNEALEGEGAPEEITRDAKWMDRVDLPRKGALKGRVMVVRAAGLNDGACVADTAAAKAPYRIAVGEITGSAPWGISRKDVGHFVFEATSKSEEWKKWGGQQVSVSY